MILMKCQILFSLKNNVKQFRMATARILLDAALGVTQNLIILAHNI